MTNKNKVTIYIRDRTKNLIQENYREDNCKSMTEFIEKAILFYCGYLHSKETEDYLPRVLGSVMQGTMEMLGNRIGKLLFKQAVECNIGNHLLAADTDMDLETYERLRYRSMREVQRTNGQISFKDDLVFQKSV